MGISNLRFKIWPKWFKTRPKLGLCMKPGTENIILYNLNAKRTTVAISAHAQ